jgi:hypothetical protein
MEDAPLPESAAADKPIEDMRDIQKFRNPTLSIKLDGFEFTSSKGHFPWDPKKGSTFAPSRLFTIWG